MKIAVNTRGFANILATATCMNHEVLSAENPKLSNVPSFRAVSGWNMIVCA